MKELERLQQQELFVTLINQHKALLYKVCNLYCTSEVDKQDLFQEIVLQLWKSYPKFRGEAKFSTWLYRIALNTAISGVRKRKSSFQLMEPGTLPASVDRTQMDDDEEQLELLYSAIRQLTDIEKAVVMMYLEEKSYEEMEEVFGISQNTLRVKMNRIREKLRKLTKIVAYGAGKS